MKGNAIGQSDLVDLTRDSPPPCPTYRRAQPAHRQSVAHTTVIHRPKPRRPHNWPVVSDDSADPIESFSDEEADRRTGKRDHLRTRRSRQLILAAQHQQRQAARPQLKRRRSISPHPSVLGGDKENRPPAQRQAGAKPPPAMEQSLISEQTKDGIWSQDVDGKYERRQSRGGRHADAHDGDSARKRPKAQGSRHDSPFRPGTNTIESQPSGSGRKLPPKPLDPRTGPQQRMSFGSSSSGPGPSAPRDRPSPAQISTSRQGASIVTLAVNDPTMPEMQWRRSQASKRPEQELVTPMSSRKGKQRMQQPQETVEVLYDDDDDEDAKQPESPFNQMTPHQSSAWAMGSSSKWPVSAKRTPNTTAEPVAGPSTIQGSSPTNAVASARKRARGHADEGERTAQLAHRMSTPRAGPSTLRSARQNEPSMAPKEDEEEEILFVEQRKSPERPEAALGGFSADSDDVQALDISPRERPPRSATANHPNVAIPSSGLGSNRAQMQVEEFWVNDWKLQGSTSLSFTEDGSIRIVFRRPRSGADQLPLHLKSSTLQGIRTCSSEQHPLIALQSDLRNNTLAGSMLSEGCKRPNDRANLLNELRDRKETAIEFFLDRGPSGAHFVRKFHDTMQKNVNKALALDPTQCEKLRIGLYAAIPKPQPHRGPWPPRADDDARHTPREMSGDARTRIPVSSRLSLSRHEAVGGSSRAQKRSGDVTGDTQAKLDFPAKLKSPTRQQGTTDHTDADASRGTRESRRLKDKPPRRYTDAGEDGDGASAEAEPVPRARKHPPPADKDLLLFPWPLNGRAEVNITAGDRYRVVDDDFLNDTMIEFGIRHVIDQQPEAPIYGGDVTRPPVWTTPAKIVLEDRTTYREEVAMLSSFFLEKLGKRKLPASVDEPWAGYDAVKRWTRNKNMFDKKMIIVPVNENFHWYLAVIINPRGVLRNRPVNGGEAEPAKEDTPAVPSIAAPDKASDAASDPSRASSPPTPERSPLGGFAQQSRTPRPSSQCGSEQDVEDVVSAGGEDAQMAEVDHSDPMNLTDATHDIGLDDGEARPGALNDRMRDLSVTASPSVTATGPSSPPAPHFATWQEIQESEKVAITTAEPPAAAEEEAAKASKSEASPAATASRPEGVKGRTAPGIPVEGVEDCLIFTLDSLGGAHKDVGNCLTKWLLFEARDKLPDYKGGLTEAVYKEVKVPQQTNMSDCGLYLIHYVQQLIQRPKEIFKFIERPRPYAGRADHAAYVDETKKTWRNAETGSLRDHWAATIDSLASEYKRQQTGGADDKGKSPPKPSDAVDVAAAKPPEPVADPAPATQTSVEEVLQAESQKQPDHQKAGPTEALEEVQPSSEEEEEHIEVQDVRPDPPPLGEMPIDVESLQESVPAMTSSHPLAADMSIDMRAASDEPDIVHLPTSQSSARKDRQFHPQPVEPPAARSLKDRFDKRKQPAETMPPPPGSSSSSHREASTAGSSAKRARSDASGASRLLAQAMNAANQGASGKRRSSRSPTKSESDPWAELSKSRRNGSPIRAAKPSSKEEEVEMTEPLENDSGAEVLVPATQAGDASSPSAGQIHRFEDSDQSESLASTQNRHLFGGSGSRVWPESLLHAADTGGLETHSQDTNADSQILGNTLQLHESRETSGHASLASRITSTPSLDLSGNPLHHQPQAVFSIKGKGNAAPAVHAGPDESVLAAGLRAAAGRSVSDAPSRHKLTAPVGIFRDDSDSDSDDGSDGPIESTPNAGLPQPETSRSQPADTEAISVDDGQDEADAVGDDGISNVVPTQLSPRKQPVQYTRTRPTGNTGLDASVRRRVISDASTVSAATTNSSEDDAVRVTNHASPAPLRQTTLPGSGTPKKNKKRRGNGRAAGPEPDNKKTKRSGANGGRNGGSDKPGDSRQVPIELSLDSD